MGFCGEGEALRFDIADFDLASLTEVAEMYLGPSREAELGQPDLTPLGMRAACDPGDIPYPDKYHGISIPLQSQ